MKPPAHAGIYLVGQQQIVDKKTRYAVKVGRGKSVKSRLDDYVTYTPFLEHLDYKSTSLKDSYTLETHYRSILAKLGEKIENGSKEWYYVSKTVYTQLQHNGFKYLDKRGNEMNKQIFELNAQQHYDNVWVLKNIIQKLTDDPFWKNKDDDESYMGGGKSNASNRLIAPVKNRSNHAKYPVLAAVFNAHISRANWAMTGEQWAWYLNHHSLFLNKFNPSPFEFKLYGDVTIEELKPAEVIAKEEPIKIEEPAPMPKIEDTVEIKAVDYSYQANDAERTLENIDQLRDWIKTYPETLRKKIMKM